MLVDIYVHSDTDSMHDLGKEMYLQGEALRTFKYLGTEVELTYDVDPETGKGVLVAVEGRKVAPK